MPPQVTRASALRGKTGKHENCIFHSNARIQPVTAWFLQSFWLTTHTHAAIWLPKFCNQCVRLGAVMGAWFRRKKVESAPTVGLYCMHNALSSVFPLSRCKHQIGEVGKQSIIWFVTFSVTLLPKTIVIGSDRVCQDYSKSKVGRFWDTVYMCV